MAETRLGGQALPSLTTLNLDELIARCEQTIRKNFKQEILPNAVYGYDELSAVTGFSISTIIRADRRRHLIGRYEGRRRYFLGSDVLKWLADKEGGDD